MRIEFERKGMKCKVKVMMRMMNVNWGEEESEVLK